MRRPLPRYCVSAGSFASSPSLRVDDDRADDRLRRARIDLVPRDGQRVAHRRLGRDPTPAVSAVDAVPSAPVQVIGLSSNVSPDPPSRNRTWMSNSGGLLNVATLSGPNICRLAGTSNRDCRVVDGGPGAVPGRRRDLGDGVRRPDLQSVDADLTLVGVLVRCCRVPSSVTWKSAVAFDVRAVDTEDGPELRDATTLGAVLQDPDRSADDRERAVS